MRRIRLLLTLGLCATCWLSACRRSRAPDQNYEKAAQLYQRLFAQKLDEAYGDPKMDEVVALLKMVNPKSLDAEPASAMLRVIDRGREELKRQEAEREKIRASVAKAAASAPVLDPVKLIAAGRDAGFVDPYGPGASIAEINTDTGGCLASDQDFLEQGTSVRGTIYRLSTAPACAQKLPGFVDQAIMVVNGKIYRRIAASELPKPPPPPPPPPAPRPAAANPTANPNPTVAPNPYGFPYAPQSSPPDAGGY